LDSDWRDIDLSDANGVQVGGGNLQLTFTATLPGGRLPVARSPYVEQVRLIAPPELIDREAELAELSRFCLDEGAGPYACWRAGPRAGKSALLSSLVLRPSAEMTGRVRIVSFFITARLAAQDTREAFSQVLVEHLASLLGQSLPAALPEATREGYLLDLLCPASVACREAGEGLVLIVDVPGRGPRGNRGRAVAQHRGTASRWPAGRAAGNLVDSRRNPPVPDDVPDWRPLRDPAIVRVLSRSQHARDAQRLGRQELQHLLRGTPADQGLLGLVTAARGGPTVRCPR
jgi:hypothetical protein